MKSEVVVQIVLKLSVCISGNCKSETIETFLPFSPQSPIILGLNLALFDMPGRKANVKRPTYIPTLPHTIYMCMWQILTYDKFTKSVNMGMSLSTAKLNDQGPSIEISLQNQRLSMDDINLCQEVGEVRFGIFFKICLGQQRDYVTTQAKKWIDNEFDVIYGCSLV